MQANHHHYKLLPYLLISLLFFNYIELSAQYYERVEQTSFSTRLSSPVKVEVKQGVSGLLFTATNSSFFQYEFELEFTTLENLKPSTPKYKMILEPGYNRLFELRIADEYEGYNFQYKTSFSMGMPKDKTDRQFPYLIPIGEGNTVSYFKTGDEKQRTILISVFQLNPGDTVYASRKGIVTASPEASVILDRIGNNSSFEVRHSDGTVALYRGINSDNSLARLGHYVYPGQAIGRVIDGGIFEFSVYEFLGEGKIRRLDIAYSNQSHDKLLAERDIESTEVSYPAEIITKELSKREKKKLKQGSLY